jgi:hypothetical protein
MCAPSVLVDVPAKMNASRSSAAVEDYLERILELINTKGYARVVDIATSLGEVSRPGPDHYG